jgi:hypothetical protein
VRQATTPCMAATLRVRGEGCMRRPRRRRSLDGATTQDVTPGPDSGFNVRTRVHEYGGGAYVLSGDAVYFSNFKARTRARARGRPPVEPRASWNLCC